MKTLRFTDIWNESVITEHRPLVKRDYCWASELYKPLVDRYLAMNATPKTNPPNIRSLRKFYAGNVWEFIAGLVLYQLGIIQDKQEEVWVNDTPIAVKGKLDYLVGGIPNYSKARDAIKSYPFQKEMTSRFMKVIDNFEETMGVEEIKPMVHEIKSCAKYLIDKIQGGGCVEGHDLQIYHYLRGLKLDEGHIAYISKDDALMAERVITANKALATKYELDLSHLKVYLDDKAQPPPAPLILFEEKFNQNFSVEYSEYLTLVYGFETPEHYRESVKGKVTSWNRVLARVKLIDEGKTTKTGKPIKLTDKNKAALEQMESEGFNPRKLAEEMQVSEEEMEEINS